MHERQMIALDEVLDRQLPIRLQLETQPAAAAQQAEVVIGPALLQRGEMLGERRGRRVEIDEDDGAPERTLDGDEAVRRLVEPFMRVDAGAAEAGGAHQLAVQRVGPGVVGADHGGALGRGGDELGAAVPADVVEGADLAVGAVHDQQRDAREIHRHLAARSRHVAGDAHADPVLAEGQLALGLEEGRVGVGAAGQADRLAGRAEQPGAHLRRQHAVERVAGRHAAIRCQTRPGEMPLDLLAIPVDELDHPGLQRRRIGAGRVAGGVHAELVALDQGAVFLVGDLPHLGEVLQVVIPALLRIRARPARSC